MKPKTIDLNDYEMVDSEAELDNYSSIILIPRMIPDQNGGFIQPATLYFRRGERKPDLLTSTEGVEWHKDIVISNKVSSGEYAQLLDWWINSALQNEEWRTIINSAFNKNNFNIKLVIDKYLTWMKGAVPSERKTHLHKAIWKKLTSEYGKYISYRGKR